MSEAALREGKWWVGLAITLAFVSLALAPTLITETDYWRPFPFVFMTLCCIHLVLGSDHARGFIAVYLGIFGAIRVIGFVAALVWGGPVARNVIPTFGVTLGLVAAGILALSKQLRAHVRMRFEERTPRHTIMLRAAWAVFLIYCAVIIYFDFTGPS